MKVEFKKRFVSLIDLIDWANKNVGTDKCESFEVLYLNKDQVDFQGKFYHFDGTYDKSKEG